MQSCLGRLIFFSTQTYLFNTDRVKSCITSNHQKITINMKASTPEPMTDAFTSATATLAANPDATPRKDIVNKKSMGIAIATALLGGTAFTATRMSTEGEPTASTATTPATLAAADEATPATSPQPLATGQTHTVAGGSITPNDQVSIAHTITDQMPFADAYHTARAEVGTEGIFTWHGTIYNTFSQAEWNSLSLTDRQTFLHNVGFKPTPPVPVEPVIPVTPVGPLDPQRVIIQHEHNVTIHQDPAKEPDPIRDPIPVTVETTINGNPAIGTDENGDGQVEMLVVINLEENSVFAFIDGDGDGLLETLARLDPDTQEVLESAPLDTPLEVTIDDLRRANEPLPVIDEDGDDPEDPDNDDEADDEEETEDDDVTDEPTDPTNDLLPGDDLSNSNDDDYHNSADVTGMA